MEGSLRQQEMHKLPLLTAHFHFASAQSVINCTLKYAVLFGIINCSQINFEVTLQFSYTFVNRKQACVQ